MSKRNPNESERVQQSMASRNQLIASLEKTLESADPNQVSEHEMNRMRIRINDLRERNRDPEANLGRGAWLRRYWPCGEPTNAW
jgi:hypothetical protein